MTGSSLSSAPETIVGPLRDEAALERLFRTHFSALCEEAKGHLGETAAPSAPKVVEAVFRHAWDDRAQINSEPELATYLHDELRRTSARELSRRAGARHLGGASGAGGHHAATPAADVDTSWAHLTRQLHPEAVRAEAQAYNEQLRHHAAEHVGDLSKPRSWKMPVLFGLVAAGLAAGAMWYVTSLGADRAITRALASSEARSLAANVGQTGRLTLDDSTAVMLAAGSKLTIPKNFPSMRAVKIDGAANFTVVPGNPEPFEVRAGNAAIIVTGTSITVRAYPADPNATIHVRNGQATVKLGEQQRAVTSGQAVVVTKDTIRDATPVELAEATNWTDRRITMARQLRDVVAEINRWYGVEIRVPELKVLDQNASVDAPLDSLRVAIAQVEKSANVTFSYEGQTMVFRMKKDSTAAPAKK